LSGSKKAEHLIILSGTKIFSLKIEHEENRTLFKFNWTKLIIVTTGSHQFENIGFMLLSFCFTLSWLRYKMFLYV